VEKYYFVRFIIQLSQSKVPRHRLFAVELIGKILCAEGNSDGHILNEHVMSKLLTSIHDRSSDLSPAVRAKALQSLTDIFKEISNHTPTLTSVSINRLKVSVYCILDALEKMLQTRSIRDEKATVRRAAVCALVSLISIFSKDSGKTKFNRIKNIEALCNLCSDPSVATRKTATEGLTTLLLCNHNEIRSNHFLLNAWANFVLPLVLDNEASCSLKVAGLFQVVLEAVWTQNEQPSEDALVSKNSLTAWRVICCICMKTNEAGSSKIHFKAMKIAFKKLLDDDKIPPDSVEQLLKETKELSMLCTESTETQINYQERMLFLSGTWGLLDSITGCFFMDSANQNIILGGNKKLLQLFDTSCIESDFLSFSLKRLIRLYNDQNQVTQKN